MNYLKIWTSFREVIDPLNDGERGRLFTAMLEYAELGTLPEFKGNERFIWPSAKQAIDRARAESEKQTANGSRGGRPRSAQNKPTETQQNPTKPNKTQQNPTKPMETPKDKEKETEKELKETTLSGGKEKPLTRFSPPSVDDVESYCRERQNDVNAQRFVDFYAAKGWRIGKEPMKDWKAAVRTWEARDSEPGKPAKTVSAHQYEQRHYQPGELDAMGEDLMAEARRERSSA